MGVCKSYHDKENWLHERGVCYGTKEREPCKCGGNESKCDFYPEKRKKQTNADKIRAMTDEELSDFMNGGCDCIPSNEKCHEPYYDCKGCWLAWLKKECDE